MKRDQKKGSDGLDGLFGGLGNLIENLTKLAEVSPNITEEQKERLAQAKEALGERGEQVFDAGPFQIATKFNIGSASKRQEPSDSWKKKDMFQAPRKKSEKATKQDPISKDEKIAKTEENMAYWKEEIETIVKEFGFDSLSDELKKMAKTLGIKK